MKTSLNAQLTEYYKFHQNKKNRISHLFGVPIVVFSVLIAAGWVYLAIPGFFLVMVYYIWLDRTLGGAALLLFSPILFAAMYVAALPFPISLIWFVASFVIGWAIQFLGHHYEGKRPALFTNLIHLLSGPLLVTAEILFFCGLKQELKHEINGENHPEH
jgi:uncharacterized membrane protein YGL010W